MLTAHTIDCPFCAQCFELLVDTSVAEQELTIDCEICCRPLQVLVESTPGQVLRLEIQPG